ncbi:hypothetical protein FOZ63_022643, partial [Perkinsus olseni]
NRKICKWSKMRLICQVNRAGSLASRIRKACKTGRSRPSPRVKVSPLRWTKELRKAKNRKISKMLMLRMRALKNRKKCKRSKSQHQRAMNRRLRKVSRRSIRESWK